MRKILPVLLRSVCQVVLHVKQARFDCSTPVGLPPGSPTMPGMSTHKLIWPSSSCTANRRSERLPVAAGDAEQEHTDFESALRLEIPDVPPPRLCEETRGLRCFIICITLCTFAPTEWLELTDLKQNY